MCWYEFNFLGSEFYCWSSQIWPSSAGHIGLHYNSASADWFGCDRFFALSIRCIKDGNSDVDEINYLHKMKIYPNPAKDVITIVFGEKQNAYANIFNIIGELLIQSQLSSGKIVIDISSLSKGIYVIQLIGEGLTMQQKLLKE